MKQRLRFTGSLILILISWNLFGQSDSTRNHFSIDATFDYGKLATLLMDSETKYEGEVGLMYGRYRITGEYGIAEISDDKLFDNAVVNADGSYYRLGFDFLLPINPKNNLFIGARYANCTFDESVTITYDSPVFNSFSEENTGLKSTWYEAVVSSETRMFAQLFLGFKVRVRFMGKYDNPGMVDVIEIPGYGKVFDNSVMALNLFLRYRINFR